MADLPELFIPIAALNQEALDAALKAALGDGYLGSSFGRYGPRGAKQTGVRLHFSAAPTPEQRAQAEALVAAHDADIPTEAQRARGRHRQRLAALTATVEAYDLDQPLTAAQVETAVRWLLAQRR